MSAMVTIEFVENKRWRAEIEARQKGTITFRRAHLLVSSFEEALAQAHAKYFELSDETPTMKVVLIDELPLEEGDRLVGEAHGGDQKAGAATDGLPPRESAADTGDDPSSDAAAEPAAGIAPPSPLSEKGPDAPPAAPDTAAAAPAAKSSDKKPASKYARPGVPRRR